MKAIILSAGQGSRLLPLTEGRPKCLLPIGPRTLIEWQVWALTQGGVDDIAVVVGYHAKDVQDLLKRPLGVHALRPNDVRGARNDHGVVQHEQLRVEE